MILGSASPTQDFLLEWYAKNIEFMNQGRST